MHANDVVVLFKYSEWANQRILAATARLTPEQFLAQTDPNGNSVRDILVHTLGAAWIWRMRLQHGAAPTRLLDPADFPTYDALVERWREEQAGWNAYVGGLVDDEVNRPVLYRNTKGELFEAVMWQILAARGEPRHAAPRRGCANSDRLRLLAGRCRYDRVRAGAVGALL